MKILRLGTSITVCLLSLFVVACEAPREFTFGAAETQDQRAYRAVAIYTGLATVAEDDGLLNLDAQAFEAVEVLIDVKSLSADQFETAADNVERSLRIYAVGAGLDIPIGGGLKAVGLSVAFATPTIASEVIKIRRSVNAITSAGRDPNAEEWARAWSAAKAVHQRIQE